MDEEKSNLENDSEEKKVLKDEQEKAQEIKTCANCGAELKDGQAFCHQCGTKADEELSKDKKINLNPTEKNCL